MERRFEPVTYGNAPVAAQGQGSAVALDQSRVLRNTYWLLALSLLPTVAGAFVGMQIGFASLFAAHPIATPLC
jgi:modulator of FtsH protease